MSRPTLDPAQISRLEQLCRWDEPALTAQGNALAESLLGRVWIDLCTDRLLTQSTHNDIESLKLSFQFAEELQRDEPDHQKCIRILPKLRTNPTLARQMLLDWPRAGSYTYPSYDLGWHLVNAGLYHLQQLGDPSLFDELLAGIEVSPQADGFVIDPERCLLPVAEGFEILIQHEVQGIVGFAPASSVRAVRLRSGIESLTIDASFDVYKWEREFPVDCSPLAHFSHLRELEVRHASPVINGQALERCPALEEPRFHSCHLPWSKNSQWSLEELRSAASGEPPLPPAWKASTYVSIETGQLLSIEPYGESFRMGLKAPKPLTLALPLEGLALQILRGLLSEREGERQEGLSRALQSPEPSRQVVWVDKLNVETWGRDPYVNCPNSLLRGSQLNQELLQLVVAREREQFAALKELNLRGPWLTELSFLSSLPQLEQLKLREAKGLTTTMGVEAAGSLRNLELGGATLLNDLSGLQHCQSLVRLKMSFNDRVSDFRALTSLPALRQLALDHCGLTDLHALPPNLYLEVLDLHNGRALESLDGIDGLRGPPSGEAMRVNLQGCTSLHTIRGLGTGVRNLHVNLANCRELRSLDGLETAEDLEKLLLVLSGCDGLEQIHALRALPKLRKLHLNVADLRNADSLIEGLQLPAEVKVVVERRYTPGGYRFN